MTLEVSSGSSVQVVLLAHGSPDSRHAFGIEALADRVRARRTESLHTAYLEHHPPAPRQVADQLSGDAVVIVPLLLAAGFHAREDLPRVTRLLGHGRTAVATDVLGEQATLAAAREIAGSVRRRVVVLDDRGREIVVRDVDGPTLAIARTLCAGVLADKVERLARARAYTFAPAQLALTEALAVRVSDLIGNAVSGLGG